MKRFRRPNTATIIAFVALLVALGGTAFAATGQIVNLADPSNAAQVAHVDATGRLAVSDGAGSLTVDGSVTAQQANPAAFVRLFGTASGFVSCQSLGTPPAGKAWIIRSFAADVYSASTEDIGVPYFIALFNNRNCALSGLFDEVHVIHPGRNQSLYEPGIAIPGAGALSVEVSLPSGVGVDMYAQGFSVPSASVPASAATPDAPVQSDVPTGGRPASAQR
jgi:hypothetical protein